MKYLILTLMKGVGPVTQNALLDVCPDIDRWFEAENDKYKLIWTAKGDWYDLDFLYLEQRPDFRAFSIYENAVDYENEFMNMFSRDAFENRRQFICGFYRGDRHGDLHREHTYLTPERVEAFVADTVAILKGIVKSADL